jgi:DNA-directed RNA polymerase specialized sigma24 family protein
MSKAHAVAQHLPFLRRYARALTGSQTSGDAYVAATLEALVKDPSLLDSEDLLRVTLFRLFSRSGIRLLLMAPPIRWEATSRRNAISAK